jgi:phage/plasmid-associated DNA primase
MVATVQTQTDLQWIEANKNQHCPICDKPDWCYLGLDGSNIEIAICGREVPVPSGWVKFGETKDDRIKYRREIPDRTEKTYTPPQTREWVYTDIEGNPIAKQIRRDFEDKPKQIKRQYYVNGQWHWKLPKHIDEKAFKGQIMPLYWDEVDRAIAQGNLVFVVEGEPTADALRNLGLTATTFIGGNWSDTYSECFIGAKAVLSPDRDTEGVKKMDKVAQGIKEYAHSIRWLYAYPKSQAWNNLPDSQGLDLKDYLEDYSMSQDELFSLIELQRRQLELNYKDSQARLPSASSGGATSRQSKKKQKHDHIPNDGRYKSQDPQILEQWLNSPYNVLANETVENAILRILFDDENWIVVDDAFYEYTGKGYWIHRLDREIKRRISQALRNCFTLEIEGVGVAKTAVRYFSHFTANKAKSAFETARGYLTTTLPDNNHLICFNNGTVDVTTGELREHSKDDYLLSHLPVDYHPNAEIPENFHQFLINSYGEEQIELVRATTSMLIDPTAPYGKFPHAIGASGSGKGALLRVWKSLFSQSNTKSMSGFGDLSTPEGRHQYLTGVSFAVAPDCGGFISNLRAFYELVDNGPMSGRALYTSDGYEKTWNCRFAMASVDYLQIENSGDGWKRRCIPIPTKGQQKPDPTLEQKMQGERGAIVSWALAMDKDRRDAVLFDSTLWSKQAQETQIAQDIYSDSVRAFVDMALVPTDDETATYSNADLHTLYTLFCSVCQFKPLSVTKFTSHLKTILPGQRVDRQRYRKNGKQHSIPAHWKNIAKVSQALVSETPHGQQYMNKNRLSEGGLEAFSEFNQPTVTSTDAVTSTDENKSSMLVTATTNSQSESQELCQAFQACQGKKSDSNQNTFSSDITPNGDNHNKENTNSENFPPGTPGTLVTDTYNSHTEGDLAVTSTNGNESSMLVTPDKACHSNRDRAKERPEEPFPIGSKVKDGDDVLTVKNIQYENPSGFHKEDCFRCSFVNPNGKIDTCDTLREFLTPLDPDETD